MKYPEGLKVLQGQGYYEVAGQLAGIGTYRNAFRKL